LSLVLISGLRARDNESSGKIFAGAKIRKNACRRTMRSINYRSLIDSIDRAPSRRLPPPASYLINESRSTFQLMCFISTHTISRILSPWRLPRALINLAV